MIAFCICFGLVISAAGAEGKVLSDFFYVLNEIIMKMVTMIMW